MFEAQMLGVAFLIVVIALGCFTHDGRRWVEDSSDGLDEWLAKARISWRQFWCGLRGHGAMVRYREGRRIGVQCSNCWQISPCVEFGQPVKDQKAAR
jgi:hypothetical protein